MRIFAIVLTVIAVIITVISLADVAGIAAAARRGEDLTLTGVAFLIMQLLLAGFVAMLAGLALLFDIAHRLRTGNQP